MSFDLGSFEFMLLLDLGLLLRGFGSAISFPRGLLLDGFGLTSFEFELPRTGVEPLSMDLGFPLDGLVTSLPEPFPLVGISLLPGAIGLGSGLAVFTLPDPALSVLGV
jgi:hypothetical protein